VFREREREIERRTEKRPKKKMEEKKAATYIAIFAWALSVIAGLCKRKFDRHLPLPRLLKRERTCACVCELLERFREREGEGALPDDQRNCPSLFFSGQLTNSSLLSSSAK
jgi:hypothetical protein